MFLLFVPFHGFSEVIVLNGISPYFSFYISFLSYFKLSASKRCFLFALSWWSIVFIVFFFFLCALSLLLACLLLCLLLNILSVALCFILIFCLLFFYSYQTDKTKPILCLQAFLPSFPIFSCSSVFLSNVLVFVMISLSLVFVFILFMLVILAISSKTDF